MENSKIKQDDLIIKKFYIGNARKLSHIRIEHLPSKQYILGKLYDGILPCELKKILIRELEGKLF